MKKKRIIFRSFRPAAFIWQNSNNMEQSSEQKFKFIDDTAFKAEYSASKKSHAISSGKESDCLHGQEMSPLMLTH